MQRIKYLGTQKSYSGILVKAIFSNLASLKSINQFDELNKHDNCLIPIYNSITGAIEVSRHFYSKNKDYCISLHKIYLDHTLFSFGKNPKIYVQSEVALQCSKYLNNKQYITVNNTDIAYEMARQNNAHVIMSGKILKYQNNITAKHIANSSKNFTIFGLFDSNKQASQYSLNKKGLIVRKKLKNLVNVKEGVINEY
jgi:prephenate dehydratase